MHNEGRSLCQSEYCRFLKMLLHIPFFKENARFLQNGLDAAAVRAGCGGVEIISVSYTHLALTAEGDGFLTGSDALIYRLIFNLTENAVKYNRPGGSVRVSVTQAPEKLLLRVSDTGCGIPEVYQRSIFQPFFRVDKSRSREYGGAGLGPVSYTHLEVYHSATEAEQKEFMKAFIERIEMFPEKRKDGSWIKKIGFNFPVPVDGEEVKELPLETETTVETVALLSQKNR